MATDSNPTGLWLIGASGNIASTVAVGLANLRANSLPPTGLVTEQSPFDRLPWVDLNRIVLGGHEVAHTTPLQTAVKLRSQSGYFDDVMLRTARPFLNAFARNIKKGVTAGRVGPNQATIVRRLRRDLRNFQQRGRLSRVIVVNVASTESIFKTGRVHASWSGLEPALRRTRHVLPPSSLYALAAILEGMPYINFTPSLGAGLPALMELARSRRVPIMGCDGKTGETLIKSVLAPMFRDRHLHVLSWTGVNILGNQDGRALRSPERKSAKLQGKDTVLPAILGYSPTLKTSIDYVEPLDDWKTAWDHIYFEGFLGTRMTMQFIWQGADSILAAPLIIDLTRFADYDARMNHGGVLNHLACFFKRPMGGGPHDFTAQMRLLRDHYLNPAGSRP